MLMCENGEVAVNFVLFCELLRGGMFAQPGVFLKIRRKYLLYISRLWSSSFVRFCNCKLRCAADVSRKRVKCLFCLFSLALIDKLYQNVCLLMGLGLMNVCRSGSSLLFSWTFCEFRS